MTTVPGERLQVIVAVVGDEKALSEVSEGVLEVGTPP